MRRWQDNTTYLDTVLDEFAAKAADLKELMSDLQNGTSEISSAIETNTSEIVRVTETTELLVSNIETIQKEAGDNHRISDLLRTEVGKFR